MGTRLAELGIPPGPPERLVLDPDGQTTLRAVHRGYVEAGAELILTDTFGGNPIRLEAHGLAERADEINRRAAEIAREAAGPEVLVAGSMGPTGALMEPLGSLTPVTAAAAFERQAAALAAGGVDVLWIETMSDLEEVRAAVEGARRGAPGLPVVATLSFGARVATVMGVRPEQAARVLLELGVAAAGANCGTGTPEAEAAIEAMHRVAPDLPLIGKPNAGVPRLEGGTTVYPETPEDLGHAAGRMLDAGARIVGVCCGGSPAQVRAIADALAARAGEG